MKKIILYLSVITFTVGFSYMGYKSIPYLYLKFIDSVSFEVVKNGNFSGEELSAPWVRKWSTPETAYIENEELVIETNKDWQVVHQYILYNPGKRYRVSFDAKSNSTTRFRGEIYDYTASKVLGVLIDKSQNWRSNVFYFTAPEEIGHDIRIRFYPQDRLARDGKIWIDNVYIIRVNTKLDD
jgi:hypothetical protein